MKVKQLTTRIAHLKINFLFPLRINIFFITTYIKKWLSFYHFKSQQPGKVTCNIDVTDTNIDNENIVGNNNKNNDYFFS